MKLGIVGSRDFKDDGGMSALVTGCFPVISAVISGGAEGADSWAAQFAMQNKFPLVEHLPDWGKYGQRAGFIRNKLIVDDCDVLLALWDMDSKGTAHSISLAREQGKTVYVVNYNSPDLDISVDWARKCRTEAVDMTKGTAYDLYVGRPSKWGNPFSTNPDSQADVIVGTLQQALAAYDVLIRTELWEDLEQLQGLTLGCWCHSPDCHAHLLKKLVDEKTRKPSYALEYEPLDF